MTETVYVLINEKRKHYPNILKDYIIAAENNSVKKERIKICDDILGCTSNQINGLNQYFYYEDDQNQFPIVDKLLEWLEDKKDSCDIINYIVICEEIMKNNNEKNIYQEKVCDLFFDNIGVMRTIISKYPDYIEAIRKVQKRRSSILYKLKSNCKCEFDDKCKIL